MCKLLFLRELGGFHESQGSNAQGHLQPVLEALVYVKHETSVWLEITTLLIPGLNDSEAEFEGMTQWVVENLGPDVPWHFTAFHPDWRMRDIPPTSAQTLSHARAIAMKNGVRYAFTGNVRDAAGQATYCHNCQALLVGRDGYNITAGCLSNDAKCRICNAACAGVFADLLGAWGSKRLPVVLNTSRADCGETNPRLNRQA
jgi:pyruvate formate lyase activating enzyme